MSLPSPSTKHTFLPLVAEAHPRFDKTSPPTTTNQSICTSTTEPPTSSPSQEPQASWCQTPPSLNFEVAAQAADQDPLLQSSLPFPHNDRHPTPNAGEETHPSGKIEGWEKLVACSWSVPHAVEHQKHAWYGSMLGMGAAKVKDEWGFCSASVSRSHTPDPGDKQ